MKQKAKVSVLSMTPHKCAVEDKLLAVRLAGFTDHNLCFIEVDLEVDCELDYMKVHVQGLLLPRWQSVEGQFCA